MSLEDCKIVELPKILDTRGNLSYVEEINHVPFHIKRCYWIYDVPSGEKRGGHSFKQNHELVIALSGSFNVLLNDGNEQKTFFLNRSSYGLYVPNGIWRQMDEFSTNSLALVLASTNYSSSDYIRNFEEFISLSK